MPRTRHQKHDMTVEEFDAWAAASDRVEAVGEAADEEGGPRLTLVPVPEQNIAWHPVADDAADHRDPKQWQFFVVAERDLPAQKAISLTRVRTLTEPVSFDALAAKVAEVSSRLV